MSADVGEPLAFSFYSSKVLVNWKKTPHPGWVFLSQLKLAGNSLMGTVDICLIGDSPHGQVTIKVTHHIFFFLIFLFFFASFLKLGRFTVVIPHFIYISYWCFHNFKNIFYVLNFILLQCLLPLLILLWIP